MDKPVLGEYQLKPLIEPREIVVGIELPKEGKMIGPYDFERPVIVPCLIVALAVEHSGHRHPHFHSLLVLN